MASTSLLVYALFVYVVGYVQTSYCPEMGALGMESRDIPDGHIEASSEYRRLPAQEGRLNNNNRYWATINNNMDEYHWIQVDFVDRVTMTALETQGGVGYDEWVTTFAIQSGDSPTELEDSLEYIMEGDERMIFTANSDINTIVKVMFPDAIVARYLRIVPTDRHEWISMRLEVIGCRSDSSCPASEMGPLGMESGAICDDQIKASSEFGTYLPAKDGRLNNMGTYWATIDLDKDEYHWIQVDFVDRVTISAIKIQGSGVVNDEWVTELTIQSGDKPTDEEDSLQYIMDGDERMRFKANRNENSIVQIMFPETIVARYLRIVPVKRHIWFSLRFEVIGCNPVILTSMAKPNTRQTTERVTYYTDVQTTGSLNSSISPTIQHRTLKVTLIGLAVGSVIFLLLVVFVFLLLLKLRSKRKTNQSKAAASTSKPMAFDGPYDLTISGITLNQPSESNSTQNIHANLNIESSSPNVLYHDIPTSSKDDNDIAIYYTSAGTTPVSQGNQEIYSEPQDQTLGSPENESLYYATSKQKVLGGGDTTYDVANFELTRTVFDGGNSTQGWEDNALYSMETDRDEGRPISGWKDNDIYADGN